MSKLFVVSNANEQWVSDAGVSAYFSEAYPEGYLSYPTHSRVTSLPSTVSEVHSDIHYSQVAHNENGITAAEGMYAALYGSDEVESVYWADEDGTYISSLMLGAGDAAVVVPVASPVYCSKQVSYSTGNSYVSFDVQTEILTASTAGASSLYATSSQGDTISSVEISIANVGTPTLTGTSPTKSGIKVSWNSVSAASGYAVYRKTSGGSWTMLGTTASTSYTDTTAKNGTTYYYTVRAYKGTKTKALVNKYSSLYWSSYDSSGVKA